MIMHEIEGFLYPSSPFDFSKSISFMQSFKPTHGDQYYSSSEIIKSVELSTISIVFNIRSIGTIHKPKLHYKIYSPDPIKLSDQKEAEDRISFFLSLNDNLNEFYLLSTEDKIFYPILTTLYGYHQVKFITPFENACWAILSTRNDMSTARKIKTELMLQYGEKLELGNLIFHTFPSPHKLIEVPVEKLSLIVGNDRRSMYLKAAIEAFSMINESELREKSYDEVKNWLLNIKGIGEWSASFILLRGLGKMEHLPFNERVLNRSIESLYNLNRNLDSPTIKEIASKYGKYKGYWAHYIRAAINIPTISPLSLNG